MKPKIKHSLHRTSAFTLIELLIALALIGIILTAVVYVNIGTVRSSAVLQARNEALAESQVAQNYMISKLKQAAYIFPAGSNIQMSATGNTSVKPGGGLNWVVGTDPIVAFVLPPKTVVAGACAGASTTTASDFCYAFYAYYAMNRGDFVAATTGANDPGTDNLNDLTSWVMVEYRGYYSQSATNFASGFSLTNPLTGYSTAAVDIPTGNQGRLLLDYVTPRTQSTDPLLFAVNASPPQSPGTTSVSMNLGLQRNVIGQVLQIPGVSTDTSTGRYIQTVYPRNVSPTPLRN